MPLGAEPRLLPRALMLETYLISKTLPRHSTSLCAWLGSECHGERLGESPPGLRWADATAGAPITDGSGSVARTASDRWRHPPEIIIVMGRV